MIVKFSLGDLLRALEKNEGSINKSCETLGVKRQSISSRLKRNDLTHVRINGKCYFAARDFY